METNKIKVFLPWATSAMEQQRTELYHTLLKAGMEVLQHKNIPADEQAFKQETASLLEQSLCSVHLLSNTYGKTLPSDASTSVAKYQYLLARNKIAVNSSFKLFLWYPHSLLSEPKEILQESFINEIRYGIQNNMIFSTAASPIQLANDIRNIMATEKITRFDVKETEIFLMFNQLDESEAGEVLDMLSDIVSVEKLNIIQDSDMDYSEMCFQQIGKSKLAVVYFKETCDWALPFVQQVWKKVGGASTNTPILLIGDEDPDINKGKSFKAPKVVSLIVSGELIPLEIKMQYDKVVETIEK